MDENSSSFDNTDFDAEWESFASESSPNSDFGQNGGTDDFEQFSNQNEGGTYFDIDQTSESGSFIDTSQSNNDIADYWNQQAQYTQPQMQGQYSQPQMQGQYSQPQMQGQNQYVQNQQMQGQYAQNQQQTQGQYTQNQQQGYPNQQSSVMDRINQNLPRQANFGYKATGFILAGILVVLIIVVVLVTKIHPKSSSTVQPNQSTEQSTQTQQAPAKSGYSLIEIPSSTNMTYGETLEGSATVKGFERYLVGNQVLYSLELDVNGLSAKYFCTFNVYGSVNKGDILAVTYQMIDGNYISILDIRS